MEKSQKFKAKKAASAVREARAVAAKAKIAAIRGKCIPCQKKDYSLTDNIFGTRLPSDGTWKGSKGNGMWTPDATTKRGQEILDTTGGKPITFKDGYLDFSPYATHRVEIEMTGGPSDFTSANKSAGLKRTPDNMTWHHHQDERDHAVKTKKHREETIHGNK